MKSADVVDGECKAEWSEPEILADNTDDNKCHQLADRMSVGIERDPQIKLMPQNQGSCMFLYEKKGCGGKATMIDVPFNGECFYMSLIP